MKTIKEWFLWADAQGYEWAHKAMHNHIVYPLYRDSFNRRPPTLYTALALAFNWRSSPEKESHWERIHNDLVKNSI